MKRLVAASFLGLLFLSACSPKKQLPYDVAFTLADKGKSTELIDQVERVENRRLAARGIPADASAIFLDKNEGKLIVSLRDGASASDVDKLLSEPFTMDFRTSVAAKPAVAARTSSSSSSSARVPSEEWTPTGVTGKGIEWVDVIGDKNTGEIAVRLKFTPEGKAALEKVFAVNKGDFLGIFIRDLLVTKVQIRMDELTDTIIISGVPSAQQAQVFADDVNVGLHARFSPHES